MKIFNDFRNEKFKALRKENDTTKLKKFLSEWEQSNPNDPELYTSAINYYYSQSKKEIISIVPEQTKKQGFELTDSSGKVVGFLSSSMGFDPNKLAMTLSYANKGIDRFPNRLDIRFGKCYVLGQIGDYDNFTTEIIKAVEYSTGIKSDWLWMGNKKLDDGEKFMLGTIQEYLKQLYDTENDSLLKNMQQIGDATLKYYPNNVEILSTTSVAYMLSKEYDKALAYLKHAEQLNPKDFIVLNNIAQGYKLKGDKANAIKYYELTEKYGDERAKEDAKRNIKELKE
jgi:tetratricopeptide (TPR) repeat protein